MDRSWLSSSRRALHLRPIDTRPNQHGRPPDLDELDQSLDEANAQLRSLLDMTNHVHLMAPLLPSTLSPTIRPHDFPDDNVRNKRRKIDSSRLVPSFRGFRYGKYGQIEPGRLRLEIVSCDGGMFSNESSHVAENILKNDTSVYCTKGNRCNIVLRHQGASVFALEELIIKAPAMNYSHPYVLLATPLRSAQAFNVLVSFCASNVSIPSLKRPRRYDFYINGPRRHPEPDCTISDSIHASAPEPPV